MDLVLSRLAGQLTTGDPGIREDDELARRVDAICGRARRNQRRKCKR